MPPNKGNGKKTKPPSAPKPDSSDHNGETDDSETKTSHDDAASENEVDLKADGNNSRDDDNISVDGTLDENIGNPTNLKRCDPLTEQKEMCDEEEAVRQEGSEAKIKGRPGLYQRHNIRNLTPGNANPNPDNATSTIAGSAKPGDESQHASNTSLNLSGTSSNTVFEPGQMTSPERKELCDSNSQTADAPTTKQNIFKRLEMYHKEMEFVNTNFPSQQKRLWQTISVALSDHLNATQPKQPAILLLASAENANPTAECLAQKISNAFSKQCTYQDAKLSGFELNSNSERAKYDLDEKISGYFEKGACSVVISRLEKIPAFATTTFYQFCENDNAPYKNVSIIFTVQVEATFLERNPDGLSNLPARLWDEVVIDFLSRSLHSRDPDRMTKDMIGGLMSRITPSVVWVNEEENLRCQ
ncbi:unnamed protein product [Clavelina lepadiformis]|uniref:Torsin-1A-interacting protein 1/2 AAA+ activator domain-containing protein n=1 Tax=Clavelina lepadiformis TaxID=159417 RepID=A0ABP0F501_CLALP